MFQTGKAFEHIDRLSYEIGPRLAGTRGERMGADYVQQQFNEMGLKPEIHPFTFVSRWLKRKVAAVVLSAAFLLSLVLSPLVSLILWAIACASWFFLDFLLPRRKSQNIVVRVGDKNAERRVALMAHIDTAPCGKRVHPSVKIIAPLLVIIFLTLLAVRHFYGLSRWEVIWLICGAAIFPLTAMIFNSGRIGKVSPGANDDAAGVATLLEVARAWKGILPQKTEALFIVTGGEEEGLKGARSLVREGTVPRDTWILNLDGIGFGSQMYILEGNGIIFPTTTDKEVNKILMEAAERAGAKPRYWWAPLVRHDHIPFAKAGYRATTMTFDTPSERPWRYSRLFKLQNARTREYPHIHQMEDLPEKLDPKTVELAGAIAIEFLKSAGGIVQAVK
ncbi:MAG: M28 family peptidase [Candidatus Hadarchaeales archaeon]